MNELIKISGVGLMGGILALTLRSQKREFAILISVITSVIIALEVLFGVGDIIEELKKITEECGIDMKYLAISVKAMGMAYVSQFAAEILRDGQENAIAEKVEAAGKISILLLTMPVMTSFLKLCIKVVNGI